MPTAGPSILDALRPIPAPEPVRPAPEDDPYATVAELYDLEYDRLESDGAFFARNVEGNSALVLGCGTGRICRLLEAERYVTGLDRSEPMLARARLRGAQLDPRGAPDDVPRKGPGGTRYVRGLMTDFDLGRFGGVIIPNGAWCFLASRAARAACLAAVGRALRPGGVLWIDVPMPSFARLGRPHEPEQLAWEGPRGEKEARRTREVFRAPERQELVLLDRYYVGEERIAESRLALRIALPAELEQTVEEEGFFVDSMYGGYSEEPIGAGSERILVSAVRSG